MNPVNLQDFYSKYEEGNYPAIIQRFGLQTYAQVDALKSYFSYLIKNQQDFTTLGGTYEHHAFAKLMLKTMSHSYGIL